MKEEMAMIASEPTKQHLFISDGYHELQRKVQSVSQAACVGKNINHALQSYVCSHENRPSAPTAQ